MRNVVVILLFFVLVSYSQTLFSADNFFVPKSIKTQQNTKEIELNFETKKQLEETQVSLKEISINNSQINQRITDSYNCLGWLSNIVGILAILVTILVAGSVYQFIYNTNHIKKSQKDFDDHADNAKRLVQRVTLDFEQAAKAASHGDKAASNNQSNENLDTNTKSDITNAFEEIDIAIDNIISSFPKENIFAAAYKAQQLGFFSKSIELYLRYLKLDPNSANALNNLGLAFYSIGAVGYKIGLDFYNNALNKDSSNITILSNKGQILYELGRHKEALECFNRIQSEDANTYNYRGLIYAKYGEFNRALACYEKAKSLSPQSKILQYNVIGGLILNNRFEEAEKLVSEEELISPNEYTAKTIGHFYLLKDDIDNAKNYYEIALSRILNNEAKRYFIKNIIDSDIPAGKIAFKEKVNAINLLEVWIKLKLDELN